MAQDTISGAREDGAAFDHSKGTEPPVPGDGKPPVPDDKPEEGLLAGKFKTPEELEKAYTELQSEFTKSRQGEPNTDDAPTPDTTDGTIASAREAEEAAADAGIDMAALNTEWQENGELSEATYEKLAKAGLDKGAVDGIIAGQEARAREAVRTMQDVAGGEENLGATLKWAAKNLSASEANAYDAALAAGDMDTAGTLMRGIMAKMADDVGSLPGRKVEGEGGGAPAGIKPFASRKAMADAMADPRYRKSEEYRAEVIARAELTD